MTYPSSGELLYVGQPAAARKMAECPVHNILMFLWMCLTWISCVTGQLQYQVITSCQTVLARVGDDVTLPCHIEPSIDATRKTVEWTRPDLRPPFVNLRQQGHVRSFPLNPLYRERTSLCAEELSHGNISLKIFGVQLKDEGTYQCFVPNLDSSTSIQLLVGSEDSTAAPTTPMTPTQTPPDDLDPVEGKEPTVPAEGGGTGRNHAGVIVGTVITVVVMLAAVIWGRICWKKKQLSAGVPGEPVPQENSV